jgi:hypothetical protein
VKKFVEPAAEMKKAAEKRHIQAATLSGDFAKREIERS